VNKDVSRPSGDKGGLGDSMHHPEKEIKISPKSSGRIGDKRI
jgi:hypothetical protein